MYMRHADHSDLPAIEAAISKLVDAAAGPHMKFASIPHAMRSIEEAIVSKNVFICGGYMLMVSEGRTWWSSCTMLIEEIVLRISNIKTYAVSDVVDVLLYEAEQRGIKAVVAGDTQSGRMLPYYEEAGFSHIGKQMFKEI